MNKFSFVLFLVVLTGCYQSPKEYISDVLKKGSTQEIILQEIEKQSSSDDYGNKDREAALYNLAFEKGYLNIALTGWVNSHDFVRSQLEYGPKDIFDEFVFKENPLLAHYGYARALRNGSGLPQDDFNSLRHFIIAALLGSENALHHMHSIYKEYDCAFQVAFIEKLGGSELEVRGVSYGYNYKLTPEQKINVQKNALIFNSLVINKAPVTEYLFDEGCLIDLEVKKMISNTGTL